MDKQKEIEKMEKDIGDCVGLTYEGERFTYTLHTQKYLAKELIERGYGDTKAAAKEAVTGFQANLTKWLAKQYRESSIVEITTIFEKMEELLEEVDNADNG